MLLSHGAHRMIWVQKNLSLKARPRGFHLITHELVSQLPELSGIQVGLLHLHLLHTSASLTLNENADPDVRSDLESWLRRAVPDGDVHYDHVLEGVDDMPAHVKSSLLGVSLTLPVVSGRLRLGTWQGIYLGEHRIHGGPRDVVAILQGSGLAQPSLAS